MPSPWRQLWQLSPRDWVGLGEIASITVGIELGLTLCSFTSVLRFLMRPRARCIPADGAAAHQRLSRFTAAIFRRWPWRLKCLPRSLILLTLLRRRGLAAELKVGVNKSPEAFQAHAWLEHEGQIVLDTPEVRTSFQAVLSLARCP